MKVGHLYVPIKAIVEICCRVEEGQTFWRRGEQDGAQGSSNNLHSKKSKCAAINQVHKVILSLLLLCATIICKYSPLDLYH